MALAPQSTDAYLAAVAMAVTDAIVAVDERGRVVLWVGSAEAMFGWAPHEILGEPLSTIVPERWHDAHVAGLARVAAGGPSKLVGGASIELDGLHRDGHEFPIELSLGRGEHRGALVFVGVIRDITARLAEQERLRVAQERFRSAFEHAPIGVTMTDVDGRYVEANAAFCALVGYSQRELTSMRFLDLTHADDRPADARAVAALRRGEHDHQRVRKRYVRSDGREVWVQVDVSVVRRADGTFEHFLTQVQDVSELEHFASTASHDLNEPLRIVDGYLALLARRLADRTTEEERELFGEARGATSRMRELIDALLTYARAGTAPADRRPIDATAVAEEAVGLLAAAIEDHGATVEVADLGTVAADRALLRQVLQNLIANAVKFANRDDPVVRVGATTLDDGSWCCSVTDNGPGIPAVDRERVFEMFTRTTTAVGTSGSGIGLAAAERAVRRHGGRIWVQDAPGGGADFRFLLPP